MTKQHFWQPHVNAWRQSKLTQKQYCDQHNLKVSTFKNWTKKPDLKAATHNAKNKFIPVPSARLSTHAKLRIGQQITIELEPSHIADVLYDLHQKGLTHA